MGKYIPSLGVKFISLLLSFAILFECNTMAFAGIDGFSLKTQPSVEGFTPSFDIGSSDLDLLNNVIENAFLKGEEGNIHEAALNREVSSSIQTVNSSAEKAQIAGLIKTGQAKYGAMYPAYVKASGAKAISKLESGIKEVFNQYFGKLSVMPYKEFEAAYKDTINMVAEQLIPVEEIKVPFRADGSAIVAEIMAMYPAKEAYAAYVTEAKADIAWREANKSKVEAAGYKVIRAYVEAIGAQNLSLEIAGSLINLELNGKKVITDAERASIYNFVVTRLEKQKLDILEIGIFDGARDKKVAAVLLKDLIESIVLGGYIVTAEGGRYANAVENLIYKSEEGIGFNHILTAGSSALVGAGAFGNLDRVLNHYTKLEQKGASFGDYISLSYYAGKVQNSNGKYLGKASELTQYNTEYSYNNTFTGLALLLAEDGRETGIKLLKKYGVDQDFKGINPFLAGALISGKAGVDEKTAASYALVFANLSLGDIEGMQEYDIDSALLRKYPGIKADLGSGAIVSAAARDKKIDNRRTFGYFKRAAISGDILIMVWGTIGLAKLAGKGIALGRSTYTAIKAGRISNNAQRIAYIKANYVKLGKYISAKNNLLRLSSRIKAGGLKVKGLATGQKAVAATEPSREAIKLDNYFNQKQLGRLYEARKTAVMKVRNASKPTARQSAKADLLTAQYKAKAAQINFLQKARSNGAATLGKTHANYAQQVENYNRAVNLYREKTALLQEYSKDKAFSGIVKTLQKEISALQQQLKVSPVLEYSAGELNYLNANTNFANSMSKLDKARAAYKATGFWNRNIVQPWKSRPSGDGTLGIWKMEIGEGTTLAKTLNITGNYAPDYTSGSGFFSSYGRTRPVEKFYNFLSSNKMGFLAQGLKFVNNRATLLGSTLLFNYHVATVTPEALNVGRALTNGTELVMNIGKTADAANSMKMLTLVRSSNAPLIPVSTMPKPVSVIDPKLFSVYNTLPLPGGVAIGSLSPKALLGSVHKSISAVAGSVAMPFMLGKDLYRAFDAKMMNLPAPVMNKVSTVWQDKSGFKGFINFSNDKRTIALSKKAAVLGGWAFFAPGEWEKYSTNVADYKYTYEIPAIPHLYSVRKHNIPSVADDYKANVIATAKEYESQAAANMQEIDAIETLSPFSIDDVVNENPLSVLPEIHGEDTGFKMAYLDNSGSEKVLPIQLSIDRSFNAKGYNRVIFNLNGKEPVAELRDGERIPMIMNHFWMRFQGTARNFREFIKAVIAQKEVLNDFKIKLFPEGKEPKRLVIVDLFDSALNKLPVSLITDEKLLAGRQVKFVVNSKGSIDMFFADTGVMTSVPKNYQIRFPKNQIGNFIKVMEAMKTPIPVTIVATNQKVKVVSKYVSTTDLGTNKAFGALAYNTMGIPESSATTIFNVAKNLATILAPMVNSLIKKYGEKSVIGMSVLLNIASSAILLPFGFFGIADNYNPFLVRTVAIVVSIALLSLGSAFRRVALNPLINQNIGVMKGKKSKAEAAAQEKSSTATAKELTSRIVTAWKDLWKKHDSGSLKSSFLYNMSFIWKNVGTWGFAAVPMLINILAVLINSRLDPAQMDWTNPVFDWTLGFGVFGLYNAYIAYKFYNTNLRDSKSSSKVKDLREEAVKVAEAINAMPEEEKVNGFKKFVNDIVELKDVFLNGKDVKEISIATIFATAHETLFASAFAVIVKSMFPASIFTDALILTSIFAPMFLGRVLANFVGRVISEGSTYIIFSLFSLIGTLMLTFGIDSPEMVFLGTIIGSLGTSNFFTQAYDYVTKTNAKAQKTKEAKDKVHREISSVMSFTLAPVLLLIIPGNYMSEWLNMSNGRVLFSLAMLIGSLALTVNMMKDSSIFRYFNGVIQDFKAKQAAQKGAAGAKTQQKGDQKPEDKGPDIDMNNPQTN